MPKYAKYPKNIKYTFSIDPFFLLLIVLIFIFLGYLAYKYWHNTKHQIHSPINIGINPDNFLIPRQDPGQTIGGISTRFSSIGQSHNLDVLNDPYIPPVKMDGYIWEKTSGDVRGLPPIISTTQIPIAPMIYGNGGYLPVNMETHGVRSNYNQIGILTKHTDGGTQRNTKRKMFSDEMDDSNGNIENTLILPLMGRRNLSGRDKWQYYTISNTGNLQTKLPVRVNGKSCSSEYGCDEIMNGDVIHVEGYNHRFSATVYENTTFSYIPVL